MIERGAGGAIVNISARPPRWPTRSAAALRRGQGRADRLRCRAGEGARPGRHPRQHGHARQRRHAGRRRDPPGARRPVRRPARGDRQRQPARALGRPGRAGRARRLPRLRPRVVHHRREPRRRRRGDRLASRSVARPREFDEERRRRRRPRPVLGRGLRGDLDDRPHRGHRPRQDASLYGAFGDKHALYMRVFDEYIAGRCKARATTWPVTTPAPRAHPRVPAGRTRAARPGTPRAACSRAARPSWPGATRTSATAPSAPSRRSRARTRSAVEAAQRAGDIDPDADADALGDLMLAIHRGTEALGRGGADEAHLRALVEAALSGLPRRP